MGEHLVRFTAEQKATNSASTVGRHEDQIATGFFGAFNDGFVRDVAGCTDDVAVNASIGTFLLNFAQIFCGLLIGQFGKFFRRRRIDQRAFAKIGNRVFRFGKKHSDARPGFLGEGYGAFGGGT